MHRKLAAECRPSRIATGIDTLGTDYGLWSLVPAVLAVTLALVTREATLSLLVACIVGVVISGEGLPGTARLFQRALGDENFVWVLLVEIFIGILVAFLMKSGATQEFTRVMQKRLHSRRQVQLFGWLLGMMIFFSDYFSPLLTGPVMRDLTDRAKISREKLAYICDSTSAPMCVLVPLSAWGVFIAGLLTGYGPIEDATAGMTVFLCSIGFNFYAIGAVGMVGLIAGGLLPEFGPMKRAEQRAQREGKVLADGATPMMAVELSEIEPAKQIRRPRLAINFFLPLAIVICVALGSFLWTGKAMVLEAFMAAVAAFSLLLWVQGLPAKQIVDTAVQGIKGVMPAVILLGLAFSIKIICDDLHTAQYVVESTRSWLTPTLLPVLAFSLCAFISFATGTSWGTYAITIPIFLPLVFQFTDGRLSMLVYTTVAAIAGGGVFGDHCSPLSDTTILSSFGAASDHIDHVKTQLPYAAAAAAAALVLYMLLGLC